jgi:hypothetical protein
LIKVLFFGRNFASSDHNCGISPLKKGSAMIKAKDVFGKNDPSCHISMKKK